MQTILNIIFIICGALGVCAFFEVEMLSKTVEKLINKLFGK